ncbi:outer membrane homotrimeric porin [Megalodesulfovibrio gigas]|uniref:Putative porin n=1 Tax=Megalodesulfovibrio gigas (strain ATCC 19364 / DSM 1382 / NCIMB 9332 / VKM B-1759) TaxID=1121448 RepID=T2GDD5_MEGG1|nr:outer membrane homotrimeric porin [Megalodesulfovibrio gigas]AGW13932.1 putative porin [Megalodesulfovibrio gigas DSM 1382 = ATCC 19364]
MERICAVALAILCGLAISTSAHAVDVKVKGNFLFNWSYIDLGSLGSRDWSDEDHFSAKQRTRLQVDFVASENLKGIVLLEIGDTRWGDAKADGRGAGGALGADGVNLETKRAFIQVTIPDTELLLSMGILGMAGPGPIAGSPLFDDDVAGILAQYTVSDMLTVGAVWARLYDLAKTGDPNPWDEFDMFAFLAPLQGDGWKVHPYVVLAAMGRDFLGSSSAVNTPSMLAPAVYSGLVPFTPAALDQRTLAWWGGGAITLDMFNPFTLMLEGLYGSMDARGSVADRRGYYLAAELDYALECVTIGLLGWYASGEDASWRNGSEQLPMIAADWNPTTFAWDGGSLLTTDDLLANSAGLTHNNPAGKWGVALLLKDISLMEDLTHQLRFLYASGTNSSKSRRMRDVTVWGEVLTPVEGIELTTADQLYEINLDSEYKIYENLACILELGLVHLQYGNTLWAPDNRGTSWKMGWGLNYTF